MKQDLRPRAGLLDDDAFVSVSIDMMRPPAIDELSDQCTLFKIEGEPNPISVGHGQLPGDTELRRDLFGRATDLHAGVQRCKAGNGQCRNKADDRQRDREFQKCVAGLSHLRSFGCIAPAFIPDVSIASQELCRAGIGFPTAWDFIHAIRLANGSDGFSEANAMDGREASPMECIPEHQCVNDDETSQEIQDGEEEIQRDAQTRNVCGGTSQLTGQQALVPIKQGLPEEQRDECSAHEERPEGNIIFPFDHMRGDQGNSNDGTEE